VKGVGKVREVAGFAAFGGYMPGVSVLILPSMCIHRRSSQNSSISLCSITGDSEVIVITPKGIE